MGTHRNFRRGWGKPKKAPYMEKKAACYEKSSIKAPHMAKNSPHKEKKVAKRPSHGEKGHSS